MQKDIDMGRLRLSIPADRIEKGALDQIYDALKLPYLKALAVMPDVHQGYDLPIGGVALLDGYIWPGAVGYDIGCGMCHVSTSWNFQELKLDDFEYRKIVYDRILREVPVGFNERKRPTTLFKNFKTASKFAVLNDAIRYKAGLQLGTLGGGNHFIEIGVNKKGHVGITIHSGSRRPGWLIGDFYMRMTGGPVPLDSEVGQAYVKDMKWALEYALENRRWMLNKCLEALTLGPHPHIINENHNHAVVKGDNVLHRKGATPAKKGQVGIIPANMCDGVWITKGLGNDYFLESASHGAGRKMSRTMAKKELDHTEFVNEMNGIYADLNERFLDESRGAYKDIFDVLKAQEDNLMIEIEDHYKPLIVVKG
jgi:tRNA-splicing ligase RtcB